MFQKQFSYTKALLIGVSLFVFSSHAVFAAPASTPTFFEFIFSIPKTLEDNIAYLIESAKVASGINTSSQTAQVSSLITPTPVIPAPCPAGALCEGGTAGIQGASSTVTSTPLEASPLTGQALPSGHTESPVLAGTLTARSQSTAPPVSTLTIANLRQEFLNELASTRAQLQTDIFNSKQASPIPGVSFAQSFQSVAPTLLSNLNNLHAGGDLTIESGNLNILSPNYGMTITSGTITITSGALSVPTLSATTIAGSPNFSGQAPTFISQISTDPEGTSWGVGSALAVQGRYAYLGTATSGTLQIFDVTNPTSPSLVSTLSVGSDIEALAIQGKYVYTVGACSSQLKVIDVSNPFAPVVKGSVAFLSCGSSVTVRGRYAYIFSLLGNGWLQIIDISDPNNPRNVGGYNDLVNLRSIEVDGKYVYGVTNTSFHIYDVSNPASVTQIYATTTAGVSSFGPPAVQGRYLYHVALGKFRVIDIANPTAPVEAGSLSINVSSSSAQRGAPVIQGKYAYFASPSDLFVIDISVPSSPVLVFSSPLNFTNTTWSSQIVVQGRYLYLNHRSLNVIQIYGLGGPYVQQLEAGGIEAGTISAGRDLTVYRNANVRGSLAVGESLLVNGPFSVSAVSSSLGSLFTIDQNGLVGLGTAVPSSTLHIVGTNTSTISLANAITGGKRFDLRTGSIASGTLDIFDFTSSTSRLTIDASGRLGIGTQFPSSTLHVSGTSQFSATSTFSGFVGIGTTQPSSTFHVVGTSTFAGNAIFSGIVSSTGITFTNATGSGNLQLATLTVSATSTFNTATFNATTSFLGNLTVGTSTSATSQLFVSGVVPAGAIGSVSAGANLLGLYVQGRYAYTGGYGGQQFGVWDVSDPSSPILVGSIAIHSILGIYVQGRYAYAVHDTSLDIIDVSNPASPVLIGTGNAVGSAGAGGLYVQGRYAYVADTTNSVVRIFDVSKPTTPIQVATASTNTSLDRLYVQGRYLYAETQSGSLEIFDIQNPLLPVEVGSSTTSGKAFQGLYVQGKYAYLTDIANNKLDIFDVSNPTAPTSTATATAGGSPLDVYVQGRYAYVLNNSGPSLQVFDVSTPTAPVSIGTVATPNSSYRVHVQGRYAYVVGEGSNPRFKIYDVGGSYIQQLEAGGIESGTLTLRNNLQVANDAEISGGLSVGRGAQFVGPFSVYGSPSSTSVFAIDHLNNVGIGTAFPSSTLHVSGTSQFSATSTFSGFVGIGTQSPSSTLHIFNNASNTSKTLIINNGSSSGNIFEAQDNGTAVFQITDSAKSSILDANRLIVGNTSAPVAVGQIMAYANGTVDAMLTAAQGNTSFGSGIELYTLNDSMVIAQYGSAQAGTTMGIANAGLGVITNSDVSNAGLLIGPSTADPVYIGTNNIVGLTMDTSQRVGIGTQTPSSTLHVVGNFQVSVTSTLAGRTLVGTSTQSAINGSTSTLTVCAISNCTKPSASTSTDTVSFFASTDGTTAGSSIIARGTITGGQADFGEYITVVGDASTYHAGDVLRIASSSSTAFEKTTQANDPHLAGVVTETAGFIAGGGVDNHGSVVIALVGRVPVTVSLENGPIHIGDPLTASSQPGVAMLQTEPGVSLGSALEELTIYNSQQTTSTQKIMAFVKTGFSIGTLPETLFSTSTPPSTSSGQATTILDSFTNAVRYALQKLGASIKNGVAYISELFADTITAKDVKTDRLCVGTTCVNGEQLQQLLNQNSLLHQDSGGQAVTPTPSAPEPTTPTPDPVISEPTSTPTSTDPVVETSPASDPVVPTDPAP